MPAFDFTLTNTIGKSIHLRDLKGKTLLIDFWFTGCSACREVAPYLKRIKDSLATYPDFLLVSISIDKDKSSWLSGIAAETYTSKDVLNLYTNGLGVDDPLIKYYRFSGFPQLMIIDRKTNLYDSKPLHPDSETAMNAVLTEIRLAMK